MTTESLGKRPFPEKSSSKPPNPVKPQEKPKEPEKESEKYCECECAWCNIGGHCRKGSCHM